MTLLRVSALLTFASASMLIGCHQEAASIRSCNKSDWPNSAKLNAEKWRFDANERIAYVAWLEVNLKGMATKEVEALLGTPNRRDSSEGVNEVLVYSLGNGDFTSCGERWLRELRIVSAGKIGVTSVNYEQRTP